MRLTPVLPDMEPLTAALAAWSGADAQVRAELEVDVYRVQHGGAGPDWVVRAFAADVHRATLDAVVPVLDAFAPTRFPAERLAGAQPVLPLDGELSGAHLLVTEYVAPRPARKPGFVLAWCGGLLARLALRPGDHLPPGGGWHRLGPTPAAEIDTALRLAGAAGIAMGPLCEALADADDASGLPETLIHADLTPPNAVPQAEQPPVIVDWVGVGHGPRIWPLAFLLFAAGPRATHVVLDRYLRSVPLSDAEWARLPAIMAVRPLTLDVWSVAHDRLTPEQAVRRHERRLDQIRDITAAALKSR